MYHTFPMLFQKHITAETKYVTLKHVSTMQKCDGNYYTSKQ